MQVFSNVLVQAVILPERHAVTISYRDCAHEVSADALTCPHCGAPRPARAEWQGEGYEWKSSRTWRGSPLVHVAYGIGRDGRLRTARGVIAIGQRAVGCIAIGIIARGILAIGIVAIGFVSLGVVAVGLLFAGGVNALALFAFGVVAAGYMAGGVHAIAWKILFSVTQRLL